MKVSLNTIKQFTDINLSVEELVAKINAQLGGVEEVTDLGGRYDGATIVHIVECVKHQNADKLNVCKVDDGGIRTDVERDPDGYVQVVCGAPNVRTGLTVVWLPPGSTVPASFSDDEPFVLGSRELRGIVSHGMLASPKELGLGDSHAGILELDPEEWKPTKEPIKPGASFAKAYGLDDIVIHIENKMFTHRPDCFGVLGVAREVAGIQHKKFTSPDWYRTLPEFNSGEGLELSVTNDAHTGVPRFMAVAIKNVEVKPSPVWLQAELVRLGGKPINNIVDVTNYIMLLTAQPTHAYDYDKLRGRTLATRMAKKGETATLLNGKTYEFDKNDIVIVDAEGVVGLGGIMGGGTSEVSPSTTNIVLECANFDMYAVRRSSMRHGLFTDALTRFNKGQSPLQNEHVLSLLMRSVFDVAGGEIASQLYDVRGKDVIKTPPAVTVTIDFINERLGFNLTTKDITTLLSNVEFEVEETKTKPHAIKVGIPFWRTDIHIPEDIVEEVGRLYGYDRLPRELPQRQIKPAAKNPQLQLKYAIRDSLRRAGSNEVLTYSFVHEKTLKNAEQDPVQAFKLSNALSPDLQYYRLSVLPSLLEKVRGNIKNGFDEFTMFEVGKGHHKFNVGKDGLPIETELMELVYTAKKPREGAPYYRAQRIVSQLATDLGIGISYAPIVKPMDYAGMMPFDQSRSALIMSGDAVIGVIGELKQSVRNAFKLPAYSAAATLDIASLLAVYDQTVSTYAPLSRFPKVSQDISLKVPQEVSYRDLSAQVEDSLVAQVKASASIDIKPIAIYQPENATTKTITYHIEIANFERTLSDKDVTELLDTVSAVAHKELGAERI